jgi:hypothetical protein
MLDDMQQRITRRLGELEPLVAEYHQLEAASAALDGIPATPTSSIDP